MAEDRVEGSAVSPATRQSLAERLALVTPGGAQTRSKRRSEFPENFPVLLQGGLGAQVWDEKGMYTDWICGLGAVSLGYQNRDVTEAVFRAINEGGPSYSLPHRLELETSELLVATLREHGLPHVEQVRWVKTGSEGTVAAMMIAKKATKRDWVLSIGYHGWHQAHQHGSVYDVPYGQDFNHWSRDTIAAVLLEACRDTEPPTGYLSYVKSWCESHGALLIFDECVTGFRWAIGGASEYFGIEPDLAVFGKGMANGYPLACVVGPERLMAHAIDISGTFGGEAVSLAACKATLEVYRNQDVIGHMAKVGQVWLDSGEATGYPCHPRLVGTPEEVWAKTRLLAAGGVLVHPKGFNVSFSHTEEDALKAVQLLRNNKCEHCVAGWPIRVRGGVSTGLHNVQIPGHGIEPLACENQ